MKELVDPRLGEAYDSAEMKRLMITASLCVHHLATDRPYMKEVKKSIPFFLQLSSYCICVLFGLDTREADFAPLGTIGFEAAGGGSGKY